MNGLPCLNCKGSGFYLWPLDVQVPTGDFPVEVDEEEEMYVVCCGCAQDKNTLKAIPRMLNHVREIVAPGGKRDTIPVV